MYEIGISEFDNINIEDARKLLAVFLLTDGCVGWNKSKNAFIIRFNNKDVALHELFKFFLMKSFGIKPGFDKIKGNRVLVTGFSRTKDSDIVQKLFSLTPTFTTKHNMIENPTISFLFDSPDIVKSIAFRIAMSCDGSIGICTTREGQIKSKLRLGCAHPSLLKEWKILAKNLGLEMFIEKDRNTWSGFHCIETNSIKEINKFKELGGFLPIDTKVCRGRFKGQNKNFVLDLATQLK